MQPGMAGGPARELQVPRQMNDLERAVDQVEKSIEVLRERIVSVLPQSSGIQRGEGGKVPVPEAACVPLASQIRDLRRRVEVIAASIGELTSEVEL